MGHCTGPRRPRRARKHVIDPLIAGYTQALGFCSLTNTHKKYTAGVYHSLTENFTLLAEFTDTNAEAHHGVENDSSSFNIGAFMSF